MLDRIDTEGGGKPPFLWQAPATVFIGADKMGQGIAKTALGSYKHQPLGWEMGMWLQRPFHFFYAGETPEGASNIGRRHKPRVTRKQRLGFPLVSREGRISLQDPQTREGKARTHDSRLCAQHGDQPPGKI